MHIEALPCFATPLPDTEPSEVAPLPRCTLLRLASLFLCSPKLYFSMLSHSHANLVRSLRCHCRTSHSHCKERPITAIPSLHGDILHVADPKHSESELFPCHSNHCPASSCFSFAVLSGASQCSPMPAHIWSTRRKAVAKTGDSYRFHREAVNVTLSKCET